MTSYHDMTILVLKELVEALDGAFISVWQSTAAWQKQLDTARSLVEELKAAGELE